MNLYEIFTIFICHYIFDFIMQDEKWALGKSKNWNDLLTHTVVYSVLWIIPIFIICLISLITKFYSYTPIILLFIPITFFFHTATDYITSREVVKKFENKHYGSSIPNFGAFSIIGLDQVLHYIQLFLTYYFLK